MLKEVRANQNLTTWGQKQWKPVEEKLLSQTHIAIETRLDKLCAALAGQDHSVEKRSLLAFAFGAVTSFIASNIFPQASHISPTIAHNFEVLNQEISKMQNFTAKLSTIVQNQYHHLEREHFFLSLQEHILSFEMQATNTARGFTQLVQGSLTSDIMSIGHIHDIFHQLQIQANSLGLNLPFSDPTYLYTLPVRMSRDGPNKYEFSIPVPLVSASFEHWVYTDAPIFLSHTDSADPSQGHFVRPIPEFLSLLFSPVGSVTTVISAGDLAQCAFWQNDHYCTHLISFQDLSSCLATLFHSPSQCMDACDMHFHKFGPFHISHLSTNDILISLNRTSLHYDLECANSTSKGTFLFGQTHFHIPEGCRVITSLFSVPALITRNLPTKIRPFLLVSPDPFDMVRNFLVHSPNLSLLHHKTLRSLNTSMNVYWSYGLSTIVLILIIILLIVLKYVHKISKMRVRTSESNT